MRTRAWKTRMTRTETRIGAAFFVLYFFAFPRLSAWVQQNFAGDGEVLVAETNVIYYLFLFAVVVALFWRFLKQDFIDLLDWLPENLTGIAVGLLLTGGVLAVLHRIPLPVDDPILAQYGGEFRAAPVPALTLTVVLIPLVEEVFYRGLLYGHLRNYSVPLALAVCIPFYALACVWRYALETADPRYLLLSVFYLPLSAAATLCYERGGSVWGTAALHGGVNALLIMMEAY